MYPPGDPPEDCHDQLHPYVHPSGPAVHAASVLGSEQGGQSAGQDAWVSPQLQTASGQTAVDVPPVQRPEPLQVSPVVQEVPSSHVVPGKYVTVQDDVPLHTLVMQGGLDVQVTLVPLQIEKMTQRSP
jgi:hypothetical protein